MARKKTKIERFFSLNWHRKRWGGGKHTTPVQEYEALKSRVIDGAAAKQTRGSAKSLDQHLDNLRGEFVGQSELVWHHAKLIVLLRRGVSTSEVFTEFERLWDAEADYLCRNLNLRWLVSATDTFSDHSSDPAVKAQATLVSILVNTIKIYETERVLAKDPPSDLDEEKIAEVKLRLIPLFSGLSCFTIGTDDTLRNMRWRLDPLMEERPVGLILKTVFDRLQIEDTAYARLKARHHRDRTGWWSTSAGEDSSLR